MKTTEYTPIANLTYTDPTTGEIKEEEWKDMVGYEMQYAVSNCGRVKSFLRKNPALLTPRSDKEGYQVVRISGNYRTTSKVHRLVSLAFHENPDNLPCVNHRDGIKSNNHAYNLEWCTHSQNTIHAFRTGLMKSMSGKNNWNTDQKEYVFFNPELNKCFVGLRIDLCSEYKIPPARISKIILGQRNHTNGWTLLGKYENAIAA